MPPEIRGLDKAAIWQREFRKERSWDPTQIRGKGEGRLQWVFSQRYG